MTMLSDEPNRGGKDGVVTTNPSTEWISVVDIIIIIVIVIVIRRTTRGQRGSSDNGTCMRGMEGCVYFVVAILLIVVVVVVFGGVLVVVFVVVVVVVVMVLCVWIEIGIDGWIGIDGTEC